MGSACSSVSELPSNDYLKRICSSECISENDPFWNALLAFSLCDLGLSSPRSSDAKLLEDTVAGMCRNFSINNQKTRNLNTFVRSVVKTYTQLRDVNLPLVDDNPVVWQMANALYILRIICKYYFENLSADLAIDQFCDRAAQGVSYKSEPAAVTDLMQLLVDIMLEAPVSNSTIRLHFEVVNLLLVLLSCYMYHASEASSIVFYSYLMSGPPGCAAAAEIVKTLLCRCINWKCLPMEPSKDAGGSLGSSLLSMLTIGFMSQKTEPVDYRREFGTRCLALLLVLANNTSTEVGSNPYRAALSAMAAQSVGVPRDTALVLAQSSVTYEDMYRHICSYIAQSPPVALLAYMLVHENQSFKTYVLSRADPEHLLLPLLAILRSSSTATAAADADSLPSSASHHVYIALIILLMLSEDDGFAAALPVVRLDDATLTTLHWPKEELPAGASLADAIVHVLLRSLRRNMTCARDHYLHTNCLAVLANVSPKLGSLHPAVCQTLVAFLSMLVRRHSRLQSELQLAELSSSPQLSRRPSHQEQQHSGINVGDDSVADFHQGAVVEQLSEGMTIIEEVLQMFMEILDSCLFHTLHQNVNLVHTMLCQRQLFERIFKLLTADAMVTADIRSLLDYFLSRLPADGTSSSAAAVSQAIESAARTFRVSTFKKPPELRFRYVEEGDRERFFVPYVWSLVCNFTDLYFNPSKIKLRLP